MAKSDNTENNFFIPMLDMTVGVLFIFIILMVFYALRYEEIVIKQGLEEDSVKFINNLCDELDLGVVDCDPLNKKIFLPGDDFFNSREVELNENGLLLAERFAAVVYDATDCYIYEPRSEREGCTQEANFYIGEISIDAHADVRPYRGEYIDNIGLSQRRAFNFFKTLIELEPSFENFLNQKRQPVWKFSGYGATRPLFDCDFNDEVCHAKNRRVEITFANELPE